MNNTRDEKVLLEFGQHLCETRNKKGLSLRKLADRAGVDYTQINRIEKGISNPTLTTLLSLADGLQEDPSALLEFRKKKSC